MLRHFSRNQRVAPFQKLFLLTVLLLPWASFGAVLQCAYLPQLFELYLRRHYAYKSLTDTIKAHTVEQFIKAIDPSKSMLLDSDVEKLKTTMPSVFATMRNGSCTALEESSKLMITRAQENEEFVKQYLGKDYKLDENVQFIIDPAKRGYAKTPEERKDVLTKFIHFQILNYLLADTKLPEAKKNLIHRYELITKRMKDKRNENVYDTFAESFALALDPHSSFLSRDNLEDFQIQMQLSLEGIGASLTNQDGFTVIEELIPGGSADRSKLLRPKDKIIAVAQDKEKPVSIIDMDLRDVVKLIRGKKGTKVKLTILRQSEGTKTFDATIVRDKIDIKEQAAKITYETRKIGDKSYKIGVINLPSFYGGGDAGTRSSSVDVKTLLTEANKEKVDGLVLNLAKNGGGLLEEAVKISGLFIRKGNVVATKETDSKPQVLSDDDDAIAYNGPLIVLTSRLSASASEILAGALKDYHRAMIVGGDHTFGKGSVQVVSRLPLDIGGMKVTTGMFFLPGGNSTQHAGVASDIILPNVLNTDDIGEKKLDYSLPPQSIAAFLSSKDANSPEPGKHWAEVDPNAVKKLAEKSKERVSKDPKWLEIKKNLDDAAKESGLVKLSEIRKKSLAEKKKEKDKKKGDKSDEDKKEKDFDAPLLTESLNIMGDLLSLK
jgi:carboxyl-terminal processing protease